MKIPSSKKPEYILVISDKPLFRQALKKLIEKPGEKEVVTAPNPEAALHYIAELMPGTIILDYPDTTLRELDYFFRSTDRPADIIVLGWKDNKLAVYRRQLMQSTPETLLEVIDKLRDPILTGKA